MKPSNDREAITLILEGCVKAGCSLVYTNNDGPNEEPTPSVEEAVREVTAVDDATVVMTLPNGERAWIWFVLGNDPEEVACDHTVNLSEILDPIIQPWWE